jgi:hypothetical protein
LTRYALKVPKWEASSVSLEHGAGKGDFKYFVCPLRDHHAALIRKKRLPAPGFFVLSAGAKLARSR